MRNVAAMASAACLALAACSSTPPLGKRQMSTYDMNTEYTLTYTADGFTLQVEHRYEPFALRSAPAVAACKAAVAGIAGNLAERRHRDIETVEDARIAVTTHRNWYGKVVGCSASAPVAWKR